MVKQYGNLCTAFCMFVLFVIPRASMADSVKVCEPEHFAEHVIAYQEEGKFCGWPANEGIWSWGDEILVGFEIADYSESDTSPHNIDYDSPRAIFFSRSKDGGHTWQVEKPKEIRPPAFLEDPEKFAQGESVIKELGEKINFTHPDFAMKLRANNYYYSYDRGQRWKGPFNLPDFDQTLIMARTDYIVLGKHECLAFITGSQGDGQYGKSFGIKTVDGGLTWHFQNWITEDFPPTEYQVRSFSIMPSTIRISQNCLITALRQRVEGPAWIDIYRSDNLGASWYFVSKAEGDRLNNPPSLVRLDDGRLCLVYCQRQPPYGLRAKTSKDNGKTWSDEIVLRDDGRSWDIGYVQSIVRSDGKVVSVYYYHTEENYQQHIAATIWKP